MNSYLIPSKFDDDEKEVVLDKIIKNPKKSI